MELSPFLGADGRLDLSRVRVDPSVAVRLPAAVALRLAALPLCRADGVVQVAVEAVSDATERTLLQRLGEPVRLLPAPGAELRALLRQTYGDLRPQAAATAAGAADDAVGLVEDLLRAATMRGASDVHVDPERDGIRIRFRVDGALEEHRRLPSARQSALAGRIKVLAGLDIAERRAPQDGAFVWRRAAAARGAAPVSYDVRVATLPVRFGERFTLRLLETGGTRLTLDDLGMDGPDLERFSRVLSRPHGLVLLTGPTGSGKTTTLYAAIRRLLDGAPLNVLTVEDPVEYEIPGIAQCEVDSTDKVSFGKALRSLLRHDPDVVMIGEIRDAESLDTAVKAALTGHLVLSTLHANDSIAAVMRLSDMGLAPHLTAATLRLSTAQRLVRRLCPVCRRPRPATAAEAALFGRPGLEGSTVWEPAGCLACAGRGQSGRIGLFELFEPDAECAAAIASGCSDAALRAMAASKGFRTLAEDALAKVAAGLVAPASLAF